MPIAGIYKGLSGMRGNLHVPFLGGGGAVMRCCYPTWPVTCGCVLFQEGNGRSTAAGAKRAGQPDVCLT
ncbi:hypothetical protein F3J36_19835 [Pantoea sp. Cy-640]|nr:hypothetical protein [Pantoea sp. Cy-640]